MYKKLALKLHPDKALNQCKFARRLSPAAAEPVSATEVRRSDGQLCYQQAIASSRHMPP